jgi:hypothetical protein
LHAIFQDAITPKDNDVSFRTDNKFANEIKPVQFTEHKLLMSRFKTWKFTAEQVRYKRLFTTEYVVEKLSGLFMFHPHLSIGITKYWDNQPVKDQLALDNLFVHTETLIKKYMDNFQSDDSYHNNGKGKGKGKANNTETGNGKGGRARSQSVDTKTHAV